MPITFRFSFFIFSPMAIIAYAAVLPLPKPTILLFRTCLTASKAALSLASSSSGFSFGLGAWFFRGWFPFLLGFFFAFFRFFLFFFVVASLFHLLCHGRLCRWHLNFQFF